jgi:hypothetical protein
VTASGWRAVAGEEFSARDSVGGVRGLVESSAPGVVFVTAYLIWGGFRIPTLAACAVVVVMVATRMVQRAPVTQAVGGVVGVGLGALWAWRYGDAGGYFVPGLWTNGATLAALLLSIAIGWPIVGVVVAVVRGQGMEWRGDRRLRRKFSVATGILAALFALKLAVQLPLYYAHQVTALGVAKLAMGIPLFILVAWAIWLMVRNVELPQGHSQPRASS